MHTDEEIGHAIRSLSLTPNDRSERFDASVVATFGTRRRARRVKHIAIAAAGVVVVAGVGAAIGVLALSHHGAVHGGSGSTARRSLGIAPGIGCGSPASFTLVGATSRVVTATARTASVTATVVENRVAELNQVELIVGQPGTVPGVGTAGVLSSNDYVASTTVANVSNHGSISVDVNDLASGTYPIIVDVTYSDPSPCGGVTADHVTISSEVGQLVVR
jgi:hypothetical protein